MKTTDTISVNPGKNTLGRVNEEAIEKLIRSSVIDRNTSKSASSEILSMVFPGTKSGLNQLKNYALPLRAIFATLLILTGLSMAQVSSLGLGIAVMIVGAFLAIGFLSRPLMLVAAAFFAIYCALQFRTGMVDLNFLSMMFGCLIFAATGSGKYSCDVLIKSAVRRHILAKQDENRKNALSYKAFHYATKSI